MRDGSARIATSRTSMIPPRVRTCDRPVAPSRPLTAIGAEGHAFDAGEKGLALVAGIGHGADAGQLDRLLDALRGTRMRGHDVVALFRPRPPREHVRFHLLFARIALQRGGGPELDEVPDRAGNAGGLAEHAQDRQTDVSG